jgi:hypothetical protein
MAVSAASFLLLLAGLWIEDSSDGLWRWTGSLAVLTLMLSHASLVSGGLRSTDSQAVRLLATAAIGFAVIDAFSGILAISGAVDDIDEGWGRLMAVFVILVLLTTALTPIVRRFQRSPAGRQTRAVDRQRTSRRPSLAAEMMATADRIEAINADPGTVRPTFAVNASAHGNWRAPCRAAVRCDRRNGA